MILEHKIIEIKGMPIFEKAIIKAPFTYTGELQDRACFFYILDGAQRSIDAEGAKVIKKNEALVKKCGSYVAKYIETEGEDRCEAVAIYFYPEAIKKIYSNEIPQFLQDGKPTGLTRKIKVDHLIEQYIQNLLIYFENPELVDEELAVLKIKELVLLLLKSDKQDSVLEFFSEVFQNPETLHFKKVVENNALEDISVDELAFLSHMSVSTFKRQFQKLFNMSPARYLKSKKLEEAMHQLRTTQKRISDIAFDCGFNELSSFSHIFNKEFGLSPTEYRLSQMDKSLN